MKILFILYIFLLNIYGTTIDTTKKYTNMLIHEDSPYLQQHANNPVNWYAWGDESFQKAKKENKLIFLSIGYSTCHWCHVMEEESFEDEKVAKVLNDNFISIKVDREEMPHIDKYYQDVHNLLNKRGGGWPLNIVLTPDRKAFFAATYIPIEEKYNRMGIKDLLTQIHMTFKQKPKEIYSVALEIEKTLKENQNSNFEKKELKSTLIKQFVIETNRNFDHENGGIGKRPKFPHASTAITLLDIYSVTKDKKALDLAKKMLDAMAKGGIYDQIEGGFYRYSVDKKWNIPHFEKMLYTNAELLEAYSKAYAITKDKLYKEIVEGIISSVKERFEYKNLLYSASDADSLINGEKEEGAYYTFTFNSVINFLKEKGYSQKSIKEILEYFSIAKKGNFEHGLNNPYLTGKKKPKNLEIVKKDLKELRSKKMYPFIDKKILTSWNAMYISSLFEAKSLDKQNAQYAIKLLDSLIKNLYINNTLYHQRLVNKKPKVKALFEDYAFLIDSLLKAYNFTLKSKYLKLAKKFSLEATNKFYKNNTWYMSDDKFKYETNIYDSSYRSPLSTMVNNLLKIAVLSDDLKIQNLARKIFEQNSFILASRPSSNAWFLRAYMGYKKEYIVLKASKEKLKDKVLINYPFLLKKVDEEDTYLACKIGVCFSYSDDFDTITKEIKKLYQIN